MRGIVIDFCEVHLNHQNAGDLNAHPEFFVPFNKYKPKSTYCDFVDPLLPALWRLRRDYFWTQAVAPVSPHLTQGWKIHISCTLKEARVVLERVTRVCTNDGTEFKFASDEFIHRKLLSKSAARQSGGKFMTIYPAGIEKFESLIELLYQELRDIQGPYILSDRQYKDSGAVFYRYGGFRAFTVRDLRGREKSMILDGGFRLVEDLRTPHFRVPEFAVDARWGQSEPPADDAGADELFGEKYAIESVLKFSNAGGVYAARRVTDDLPVVIKEARPHVDAEVNGLDPLSRLKKEQRILHVLEGSGIAPRPLGWFVEWEHTFLVQERVAGKTLREYCLDATKSLYPGSSQAEVRTWLEQSAAIGADLIEKVRLLHANGIVFGDISTNNIMIDPESMQLRFIDFEGALQVGVDENINIYTPGFCAPDRRGRDVAQMSDDCYALGCVLLALLAPSSVSLDIIEEYPERILAELMVDVGLPREFNACIKSLLRDSDPDLQQCRRLLELIDLDRVTAFSAESADMRRPDVAQVVVKAMDYMRSVMRVDHPWRPFPLGPQSADLIAIDHGVAGVALVWQQVDKSVPADLKGWMARSGGKGNHLPGLLNGLCGLAWVQSAIGLISESERTLTRAAEHQLLHESMSLGYGYAGYGMACLKVWLASNDARHLDAAVKVGKALRATGVAQDTGIAWSLDANGYTGLGLHSGGSGIALFLLYLGVATGEDVYIELAMQGLDHDISHGRTVNGAVGFPSDTVQENRILYPYLGAGTAGVASVAVRMYAITRSEKYKVFVDQVKASVSQKYTVSGDLFLGLSGIGHYLLDAAQFLEDDSYRALAWRVACGLDLFRIDKESGVCFPGGNSPKISCSLAGGGAGIISYLDRLAGDKRNEVIMLDELLAAN
ncbi:class III lanthionine synthetase LanKC [Xanthomonas indica]|uniref:Class III lanthionine synthetase LanKC n=1 Tax=Xanthomonas indica TaxID=2912242 RepID=A0AAU8I5A5_9XANT|nr:class III lanthionine synthetase LanKC [Xanthomonas indica]MCI2263220.1 class III lanthionine synthetase LanKC [Xanthomonas indica]